MEKRAIIEALEYTKGDRGVTAALLGIGRTTLYRKLKNIISIPVKKPRIAIDATYSLGPDLSGVGVYSRELLNALALARPDVDWQWLYRPHRYLKSRGIPLPSHVARGILFDAPLWRSASVCFMG